jgi:hypothetical protein
MAAALTLFSLRSPKDSPLSPPADIPGWGDFSCPTGHLLADTIRDSRAGTVIDAGVVESTQLLRRRGRARHSWK